MQHMCPLAVTLQEFAPVRLFNIMTLLTTLSSVSVHAGLVCPEQYPALPCDGELSTPCLSEGPWTSCIPADALISV